MVGILETSTDHRLSMNSEISPQLLGVLIGIVGTLAVTALAALLNRTTEHRRWLRQERLKAYTDLLAASSRLFYVSTGTSTANVNLHLSIGADIATAAHRAKLVTDTAYDEIEAIEKGTISYLRATMRNEEQGNTISVITKATERLETKARAEFKNRSIQ